MRRCKHGDVFTIGLDCIDGDDFDLAPVEFALQYLEAVFLLLPVVRQVPLILILDQAYVVQNEP